MKEEDELLDQEEAEEAKEIWYESQVYRDQFVLERLRAEGFCLGVLEADSDPDSDFLIYLDGLGGWPNLLVAAPAHTLAQLRSFYAELPHWQFEDGTRIEVLGTFFPDPNAWFRFQTEVVFRRNGEFVPAAVQPDNSEPRWAHCADLQIIRAGVQSRLRVIHVSLDKDSIFSSLLAPQSLVPRRLVYEW
jgi:hypothetical protein